MNIEEIRTHAIAKPGVEECFPLGEETLVFKVNGKIFLLLSLDSQPLQFNAKCDPEMAVELRERYDYIIPGYHMNKKHWNTIIVEDKATKKQIRELIDHSYQLVSKKKTTKK